MFRSSAWLAVLASLALAAPAVATPDRFMIVTQNEPDQRYEGKLGSGFTTVIGRRDETQALLPDCTPALRDCDTTLVYVDYRGKVVFSISSNPDENPLLTDIDIAVYESDENGTEGELVGKSSGPTTSEAVTLTEQDSAAGAWYLVKVSWYLGVGRFDGRIQLRPSVY